MKDLTISAVIGALASYLPFWEIDRNFDRVFIGFAVAFLTFMFIYSGSKEDEKR